MSAVAVLLHQSPFGNIHVVDELFLLMPAAGDFVLVGRSVDGDVEPGSPPGVGCTDREGWQEHCKEKDGVENVFHCFFKVRACPRVILFGLKRL